MGHVTARNGEHGYGLGIAILVLAIVRGSGE